MNAQTETQHAMPARELIEVLTHWERNEHDIGPEAVSIAIERLARRVAYDLIVERDKPPRRVKQMPAGAGPMPITRGDWLEETEQGLKALLPQFLEDGDYEAAKLCCAIAELVDTLNGKLADGGIDDVEMPESVLA